MKSNIRKAITLCIVALAAVLSCFTAAIAVAQTSAADQSIVAAAASKQSETSADKNFVETDYRKQFLLSGWRLYYDYEFKSFEEQTRDMIDAGLNWMMWTYPWEDKNGNSNTSPETLDEWKYFDRVYGELGLKYMLKYGTSGSAARVSKYIEWLPELNNCEFLYVEDEPNYQHFGYSSEFVKTLVNAYPSVASMVNLLPSYGVTGSYYDYVQTWVDTVGKENLEYLSFDFYPFRPTGEYEASYFSDLEVMRKVAYENDKIKTYGYIQSGSWAGTRRPNPTEIRWNMNAMLAYGFKGMNHFCWVSPYPGNEHMNDDFPISRTGEKSEYYDDIVDTNWAVRAMGNVLMNYDCLGAYHTDNRSSGAERLPENFVVMPLNKSELVISYLESKDGSEDQIMVFNKSLQSSYSDRLLINSFANIEGVKQFCQTAPRTTQYSYNDLDISDGYIDVNLEPGEVALYKLMGDNVMIPGSLVVPEISLDSGIYTGDVTVSLDVPKGMNVYYTLDGSYPTNESIKYNGAITIKSENEAKNHDLRFIAYQGPVYSEVAEREYVIMPGSTDLARSAYVSANKPFLPYKREGDARLGLLTDGKYDKAIATALGEYAYVTIDLGESAVVEKAIIDIYGDNRPNVLAVDASNSATFETYETMYRFDEGNLLGQGGTYGNCIINKDGKQEISADTLNGKAYRYFRVYDRYDNRTVFTEIEIYKSIGSAAVTKIPFEETDWDKNGKNWMLDSDSAEKTDEFSATSDEREGVLIYNGAQYSNCVLEANFKLTDVGERNYGAVGFMVGVNDSDSPILAGVRADGKGVVFVGDREYSVKTPTVNALTKETYYNIRVVAADSYIKVYVNGAMAIEVSDSEFTVKNGTVGIWGSVLPVTVKDFTVTQMQYTKRVYERNIESTEPVAELFEFELYTDVSEVLERLPSSIAVYDNYGITFNADVIWDTSLYDGITPGYGTVTGEFANLPQGVVNRHNITVTLNIFVRYNASMFELKDYVAKAKALTGGNYTSESYAALNNAVKTAEELLNRTTATQNDYGVSVMNIDNAMQNLQYSADAQIKINQLIALYADLNMNEYYDCAIKSAFVKVLAEFDDLVKEKSDVKTLTSKSQQLNSLKEMLVTKEEIAAFVNKIEAANADGASERAKAALATAREISQSKYVSRIALEEAEKALDFYFA